MRILLTGSWGYIGAVAAPMLVEAGHEVVEAPFQRLAAAGRLASYAHDGFWACMDTFKDKQLLKDLYSRGQVPWEVWKDTPAPPTLTAEPTRQGPETVAGPKRHT